MSPQPYDLMNSAASSPEDLLAKMGGSSLTSNCIPIALGCGLAGLVFGGLAVWAFMYSRYRREISALQTELHTKEAELDDSLQMTKLKNLKAEQQGQRDRLIGQLREVETEREENRRNQQAVEQKIREVDIDKREGLLREQQNLFNAQCILKERKKNTEEQKMFIETLLVSIEIHITKTGRKKDV